MTITLDRREAEEYTVVWSGASPLLPPRDSNPNQLWQTRDTVRRCPAHRVWEWDVDDESDGNAVIDTPLAEGQEK